MSAYAFFTGRARIARLVRVAGLALLGAACGGGYDGTKPLPPADQLTFTNASINSLDSTTQVIVQANPGNGTLRSLADSTLLVLTAGVQAKRVNVSTNLTSVPLYFVGIHRTVNRATGAFSTWTLVGIDDPSHLANIVEVAGFAQVATGAAPTAVSGTVGGGTGSINGRLLQVGNGGAVTEWEATAGSASFASDAPTAGCPGYTAPPNITCAIEQMHVSFTLTGSATGGSTKTATQTETVDVPAMRLTYTP
jgi:hypothetical protein